MKDARHNRPESIRVQFYEMFRIGKFTQKGSLVIMMADY